MRNIFVLAGMFLLAACSNSVGRLDQGIIELNQRQSHFIRAWGLPDRQYVTSGDEIITANVKASGNYASGGFFKGKQSYEVWVYGSRKTNLIFNSERRLAGYKTDMTRQELQDSYIGPPPAPQPTASREPNKPGID